MKIPVMMKAARTREAGAPLILEELEMPEPGPYEALIGTQPDELPIKLHYLTTADRALLRSSRFSTEEGRELAALVESGAVNVSVFDHQGYRSKRSTREPARDGVYREWPNIELKASNGQRFLARRELSK